MKQSICILALALVSLQSAKSYSQVTILSSGWKYTGACYSLARYHGEYFIEGHQGHLKDFSNIESLEKQIKLRKEALKNISRNGWSDLDRLRSEIYRTKQDTKAWRFFAALWLVATLIVLVFG